MKHTATLPVLSAVALGPMACGYILEMMGSRGFVATEIQFVSDNPALVASTCVGRAMMGERER